MILLLFLPLFLPFFILSSFLVLNTLDRRSAARDILYNLSVRNSCALFDMHSTSSGNAFPFFLFPDSFFGDRKGFVQSVQSEI